MGISAGFGDAQQWAQTHFGEVVLGDVRRSSRTVRLAAGWVRQPGASIPRLSQGESYASKEAYQLLGHAQDSPDALQGPHQQLIQHYLQASQRLGGATGKGEPVPGSVVRVWEETGPRAAPGLEWLLLCDQPVMAFARARSCARQYTSRWLVEDFHKALKAELGAEKLQLQTAARLFAAVALLSVVALAMVDLCEKNRLEPDAPAESAGLTDTELRVLRH